MAVALASLMAVLTRPTGPGGADPLGSSTAERPWLWTIALAAVAANVVSSLQPLASARTAALWCAYAFLFLFCRGLLARDAGKDAWPPGGIIAAAVITAGTGLAAHGLYQCLFGFDRLALLAGPEASEALRARIASGRAMATLGLPGALAGFLALSIPLTFGWASRPGGRGPERALAWLLAGIQAAGLVATRSAAGILCVTLAGGLAAWWNLREDRRGTARAVAVVLIAAGLAGAAGLMALRWSARTSSDEGQGPFALRLGNWNVALAIFAEHPVLGAGVGCYGIAFPRHRTWEMNESRFAHNSYLQILAEGGMVPGAAAAILAGALALRLRRFAAARDDWMAPFLSAACLSFLLHNLADFTFYLPTVGFAFFGLASLACGPATPRAAGSGVPKLLVTGAALGLAAFALMVTRADIMKEAALRAVRADPSLAANLASDAVERNPFDPDSRSILSHLLLQRGMGPDGQRDLAEAEAQAVDAVDLDPQTPHHWHHLGQVRLARRDPLGAYIALTRAAQLYPIKIEYRRDRDAVAGALSGGTEPR
ncbi:MAG TPA: O-antigen ligase family protein [Candidatus Polarisedimenticolia bacterium]|jgi:O-antigen ligase